MMNVTKTNFTKRFCSLVLALVTIFTTAFAVPVKADAATYDGGYAITYGERTVYSDTACTTYKGKLYAGESFTVLGRLSNNTVYWIEYSTSGNPKEGYIKVDSAMKDMSYLSCVATMNSATNVYYGNSSSTYLKSGSVSAGERVVEVSRYGGWSFIEYNTTNGRKRGYVLTSSLTAYNRPENDADFYFGPEGSETTRTISNYCKVYGGPSNKYAPVGSVGSTAEVVTVRGTYMYNNIWSYFIEYSVSGSSQKKCGYIMASDIS